MQESPFARRHDRLVWKLALAVVAIDTASKSWALQALSDSPWHLPGVSLQLSLDTNSAPWLGAGAIAVMGIFDLLVLAVIAVLARETTSTAWGIARLA